MPFTDQDIAISLTDDAKRVNRPHTIAARVCGPLAYHRSLSWGDEYWTVTHVPTGYAVCDPVSTEQGAQMIIDLALRSGIDWSSSDIAVMAQLKDTPAMNTFVAHARAFM